MVTVMSTQDFNTSFDADADPMDDSEFRSILAEFLQAMHGGEAAAFDRFAKQYPHYAPALLQVGFFAAPIEARMQTEAAQEHDTSVANGIKAAIVSLGIAPARTILETRKARGWSLGDLARRLLLPSKLTLKIERGQIGTWSLRLAERLAEVLETAREDADAILMATAGSFRREAAAFSAEGDPEVETIGKRRQETLDFDEALSQESLTPEQAAYWKADQ